MSPLPSYFHQCTTMAWLLTSYDLEMTFKNCYQMLGPNYTSNFHQYYIQQFLNYQPHVTLKWPSNIVVKCASPASCYDKNSLIISFSQIPKCNSISYKLELTLLTFLSILSFPISVVSVDSTQCHSQPHCPGGQNFHFPHSSSNFDNFFLIFSQTFVIFFRLILGLLAHPGRPLLRHWFYLCILPFTPAPQIWPALREVLFICRLCHMQPIFTLVISCQKRSMELF